MTSAVPSDAPTFLRELVSRIQGSTLSRLGRTTPESLYWQPDREANSIGVTIWHYTRWLDLLGTVTLVDGTVGLQHWFRDGWSSRTGYDPRGLGLGGLGLITGYTIAEMLAVPHLTAAELGDYHRASVASLLKMLEREDLRSLARAIRFVDEDTTRFELVLSTLLGATRHLGEIDALLSLSARRS